MIRYSEVENLPVDHPKMVAFMKQEKDLDDCYATAGPVTSDIHDEESLDHFNRFVAGDR